MTSIDPDRTGALVSSNLPTDSHFGPGRDMLAALGLPREIYESKGAAQNRNATTKRRRYFLVVDATASSEVNGRCVTRLKMVAETKEL